VIPEDVIAEILRRVDIVELIGGYLPLRAAGRTHKALCPFHTEKTPSFVVNPERQIFHCFGCNEGGDAITFLMKHERLDFMEAVCFLAERAGVPLPAARGPRPNEADSRLPLLAIHRAALQHFRENLAGADGATARDYLAERGLSPEAVDRFELGYALPRWDALLRVLKKTGYPEKVLEAAGLTVSRQSGSGCYDRFRNRLMIPIWDVSGKAIAFGGRALESTEVKYLNSPETALYRKGSHLYGLNLAARAIRERKVVIVVEGYFDAITLHAHGFDHAVAALGTALTTDQARLLGRYAQTVVLLFDPDAPGIGAARRNLEHLINVDLNWRIVLLSGGLDPDAFLRKHGAAEFQAALDGAQDLVDFFLDRRVSGLDLNDPVERARAVDGLIEVVGLIDSPLRREGYIQRIAQRAAISDRTLLEAAAQRRGRIGRQDAKAVASPAPVVPPTAEEQLVYIGLHHAAYRDRIAAALAPEEIRDPTLQRIFVDFVQGGQPGLPNGAGRPMSLQPPEVQRRLSSLLAAAGEGALRLAGEVDEGTLAQVVEDCLKRIATRRDGVDRTVRRQALAAADRQGDDKGRLKLLSEHPSVNRGGDKTTQGEIA
jgi:DNA primase